MNENPLFETAKCTQLGILVHDIEKSSQAYAAFLGVPVAPVQMTGVYEDAHTTYLGQPTKARCKQAFFYYGGGRWATGHYAYLDATESLHVIIELLENGQFEV